MSQGRTMSQTRPAGRVRSRSPVSRPTTPLRASSRSSFRASQSNDFTGPSPLDAFEPQFAELSDSIADLEANLMHLQLMHESLSRFGESFASFLYGLNMNAFVAPIPESIKRFQKRQGQEVTDETTILQSQTNEGKAAEGDATLATVDASFTSMKATPRRRTMGQSVTPSTASTAKQSEANSRGASSARGSRGSVRGGRASALPRGRGRPTK
ncbi:hypothetical protein PV11_04548 [Exophiala sideris]|uniref:DASH complex subunit DAM1 n=1 Tax=Exophiala sideris TaxID=1016849 RepID=A0A0D1Z6E2_9EURO|nr:hypothetical protein PV11_04548 [Exophiala sideris]